MNQREAERLADQRLTAKEAIDDILKFYRQKPADIPEHIENAENQLKYALRQSGLMVRDVELEENWHRDAYGPMLGYMKDSGAAVALLPGKVYGYCYKDPATGRKIRVSRKNEKLLAREALCFYQPLPMKKLGIPDLLLYMKNSVSTSDFVLIALATLAVTLVGFIEPRVYSLVTGTILKNRNINLMMGMGVFLLASSFANQMIGLVKSLLMERMNTIMTAT